MNWIIPFKGRRYSGPFNQNFLFQKDNIYVMDNHRAAMWCWLNFYNSNIKDVGIFHLDRHSDALQSNLNSWVLQASGSNHVNTMNIHSYLSATDQAFPESKLFRWDNYLSIFLNLYQSEITCCNFSIYEGDPINHSKLVERKPWDLPENLSFWFSKGKWIINIDLDYFFHEVNDSIEQMYSLEYLRGFFNEVAKIAGRKSEVVVTVCFSPECCGGWAKSEKIWEVADSFLNTGLILPP
jgi:hypothetical protein